MTHQPDDLIGARRVWSRDWGVRKLSTLPIGLNPVLLTGVSLSHPPGLRPPRSEGPPGLKVRTTGWSRAILPRRFPRRGGSDEDLPSTARIHRCTRRRGGLAARGARAATRNAGAWVSETWLHQFLARRDEMKTNHASFTLRQIGQLGGQEIMPTIREAVFDWDTAPFGIANVSEATAE